jgi:nitrite reductase (NADH) small subunit
MRLSLHGGGGWHRSCYGYSMQQKGNVMNEYWKLICKLKDIPPQGMRLVPRGLAWQELPGVAVHRTLDDQVFALLEDSRPGQGGARRYAVKLEDGKIYLDLNELNAPASRAEAALAGAFGVAPHVGANPWA